MEEKETVEANEVAPKRRFEWVLKCEELDSFLIQSWNYKFRSNFRDVNELCVNLYEPLEYNACSKLTKKERDIEILFLSPLGEIKSKYTFKKCVYECIESSADYTDASACVTKITFSFVDLVF